MGGLSLECVNFVWGLAKLLFQGSVNFAPALAHHFFLDIPAKFLQPVHTRRENVIALMGVFLQQGLAFSAGQQAVFYATKEEVTLTTISNSFSMLCIEPISLFSSMRNRVNQHERVKAIKRDVSNRRL